MEENLDEELFRHLMMAARKTGMQMRRGPQGPEPGPGCEPPERMGMGPGPELPGMRFMGHGPQVPPEFRGPHGPEGHGPGMMRPPLSREFVLMLVAKKPEGIHQKEISEQMHINPSSVSELIDKLEDDGYLERRTDPSDRRATLLVLTEKGTARAAEVEDERSARIGGLFEQLSEAEKKTLNDLLVRLIGSDSRPEEE